MQTVTANLQPIPVNSVIVTDLQVRKYYDRESLMELSQSWLSQGQLQNIIVRPYKKKDGQFELVLGSRRLKAAQKAGEKFINAAVVKNVNDAQVIVMALTENIHRQDLTPFEEAAAFVKLIKDYKMSIKAITKQLNRDESFVHRRLKLLSVPKELQDMVAERKLTVAHIGKLAVVTDPEEQKRIAKEVVKNNLNEEDLETFLQQEMLKGQQSRKNKPVPTGKKLVLQIERQVQWVKTISDFSGKMGQAEIHNVRLALKKLITEAEKVIKKFDE